MTRTRIAKRYARALFELASEANKIEPIGSEIQAIRDLLATNAELHTALLSPVLPRTTKAEILDALIEAAGVDPLVGNFLRVLLEARKLPALGDICDAYATFADEAAGRVRGEAVTPMALAPADLDALRAALSKALDKEVFLDAREDPSILGGVVARVGNLVFDGSLRTQLIRMKETLTRG